MNRMIKIVRITGVTTALALVLGLAGTLQAQYTPTGADGITASPKLRERLDERERGEAAPVKASLPKMMCSKCTDTVTSRIDDTARGANKPTLTVVSHGCGGCETTVATIGVGKAARNTSVHTCGAAATMACCNTTP